MKYDFRLTQQCCKVKLFIIFVLTSWTTTQTDLEHVSKQIYYSFFVEINYFSCSLKRENLFLLIIG